MLKLLQTMSIEEINAKTGLVAKPRGKTSSGGKTALHMASATGPVPIVLMLMNSKADPEKKDTGGKSSVDLWKMRPDQGRWLLEHYERGRAKNHWTNSASSPPPSRRSEEWQWKWEVLLTN